MHRKILVISMLIPSIIVTEQPKEVTAKKKYYLERENAKSDLKLATLAAFVLPTVFIGIHRIMTDLGSDEIRAERAFMFAIAINAGYIIYKGFTGLKHYFKPDYPKPEDKSNKLVNVCTE